MHAQGTGVCMHQASLPWRPVELEAQGPKRGRLLGAAAGWSAVDVGVMRNVHDGRRAWEETFYSPMQTDDNRDMIHS